MAKSASFESKLGAVVRTALRPGLASSDRVEFKYTGGSKPMFVCLINGSGSWGATPSAALDAAIASWNRTLLGQSQTKKRVSAKRKPAAQKRTSRRSR